MQPDHILPFFRLRIGKDEFSASDGVDLFIQGRMYERFFRLAHFKKFFALRCFAKAKNKK
jgi:hypothetical protein